MSLGHGGHMDLALYDNTTLIYVYCCYNINNDNYEKHKSLVDGEIVISKDALVEPKIYSKLKKMPSGRKRIIEKRVIQDVPWDDLFNNGKITIKNASGTWNTNPEGIDTVALDMLFKLFNEYQKTGEIPRHVVFFK